MALAADPLYQPLSYAHWMGPWLTYCIVSTSWNQKLHSWQVHECHQVRHGCMAQAQSNKVTSPYSVLPACPCFWGGDGMERLKWKNYLAQKEQNWCVQYSNLRGQTLNNLKGLIISLAFFFISKVPLSSPKMNGRSIVDLWFACRVLLSWASQILFRQQTTKHERHQMLSVLLGQVGGASRKTANKK